MKTDGERQSVDSVEIATEIEISALVLTDPYAVNGLRFDRFGDAVEYSDLTCHPSGVTCAKFQMEKFFRAFGDSERAQRYSHKKLGFVPAFLASPSTSTFTADYAGASARQCSKRSIVLRDRCRRFPPHRRSTAAASGPARR